VRGRKLGAPEDGSADAETWTYAGLVVTFDAFGDVSRLLLTK
jgi:hypothetical protein